MSDKNIAIEQVPAWYYGSQELYDLEIERVFKRSWLNVLREERIPNPGDFSVVDILDTSILITRAKTGKVHAFHNFCTHRGTKLCIDPLGHSKNAMACVYHGWVFDAEGKLVGLPREEQLWPGIDKARLGLKPIHCDTWGGFIFVYLDDKPEYTLKEWLGPVYERTGEYLSRKTWYNYLSYEAVMDCNWKFGIEAQMEGNHAEYLHMRSAPSLLPVEGIFPKPYDNVPGVQGEITVYFNLAMADKLLTPVEALAYKVGRGSLWEGADVIEGQKPDYGNVLNLEKRPDWFFDQFTFWPNWVNFNLGGVFSIQRWWPLSRNKTFWTLEMWMDQRSRNFGEFFFAERNKITQRDIIVEDLAGPMYQQAVIESGKLDNFMMCDQEILIRKMYHRIVESTRFNASNVSSIKKAG
jgi:phenylpropionate dioxygenase-like ring-hydroxylating dioxygenase large terminal subunit